MKYEYTFRENGSLAELIKDINQLGADEWELTSVVVAEVGFVAFLKREPAPLEDASVPDAPVIFGGGPFAKR